MSDRFSVQAIEKSVSDCLLAVSLRFCVIFNLLLECLTGFHGNKHT